MQPAISLIIPAYNREKFIRAAIGSVLNQSRRDFELLVWDDGSTDATAHAAEDAAKDDPRVRVVRGPHQGLCKSLNAAAAQLSSAYFGWVDSDDALAPAALAETSAVLDADAKAGMVYTQYMTMNETGRVMALGSRCKIPYTRERLLVDFMTFQFRLMRRTVFDAVGGVDESMERAEDYDLCLKLSEMTQIKHVAKPLYFYRLHANTVSRESRVDQIHLSAEAIRRALARRGLDKNYDLDVEIVGRYHLRKKTDVTSK